MTTTVNAAFRAALKRLTDAGFEDARADVRVLLGHVLGGGAERVLAEGPRALTQDEAAAFEALLARRLAREPISQILGTREFWSLNFKVTRATLTPRPDTETLIEALLEVCPSSPQRVLDLGTGTGCILLALLSEWPKAQGLGVDVSADALAVARDNAAGLGLQNRAEFTCADWSASGWVERLGGPFDVVVSNPPYIPAGDMAELEADVRDYEPRCALEGGADGLDAYRAILAHVEELLCPGGVVAFEVGIGQAHDVAGMMNAAGLDVVERRRDLGGIVRALVAHAPCGQENAGG